MQPARTVGLVQFHHALVVRRGLASFARDVRDDADLARELFEIHFVSLDVCTYQVVEGAVVRALRVFPVDEAHGCGDEVEVAARSESAGRACRPARQEHAALPLPAGTRTAIQRDRVCDVALGERFSPFLKHVCSRRTARILQLRVLGDALVHTEASLDAESHARATQKQLAG